MFGSKLRGFNLKTARTFVRAYARHNSGCPIRSTATLQAAVEASAPTNAKPRPFDAIPGPKSIPEQGGTAYDFVGRLTKFGPYGAVQSYYNEFSEGIFKHDFAGRPEVFLLHPEEVLKLFRNEGKYPLGLTSDVWPFQRYFENINVALPMGSAGPEWKRMRNALQKDMFPPKVAETYLPVLNRTCQSAVDYVPKAPDFGTLSPFAAFDLIMTVMLGYSPNTITQFDAGSAFADPADVAFARDSMAAMAGAGVLLMDGTAYNNTKDPRYIEFTQAMDRLLKRAHVLVGKALQDISRSPPDLETAPYFARLLARGEISEQEAVTELCNLVFAGVDTTSHVLQWLVYNLARYPQVQDKLRTHLNQVLGKDGNVTDDNLPRLDYLNMCIRESHRLTPPGIFTTSRWLPIDSDFCGYSVPAKTKINVMLGGIQMDPKLVDEPDQYLPERWSDEAVAKREGTPKQVIDHMLLKKPFSFGARMCLGARIAELEIKTFVAHLVRRYQFELDPKDQQVGVGMAAMCKPQPFPHFKYTVA